jgi:tetratricopeptide (TPR) repeat protein
LKKKVFIILFVLPIYLFAFNVEQTYAKAVLAYKAKDFATSYKLFSKLYLTKLSDVKLNFKLGKSAYETGHYEVALAAFERVEMLSPTNIRNKLEKARTYFMLKMYEDSELLFKEVLSNPMIPKNVQRNVELYLAKVKKVQQKSFTYATIGIDWLYDSNVNYGSLDNTYNIGTTTLPTSKEQVDSAVQVSANIVNIYDIGDTGGFALKNNISIFIKDYKVQNDYDMKYLAYMPSLVYKYTKYTAEMLVGVDTMTLAKKLYLKTYYLMPKLEYAHTHNVKSIMHIKYQRKYFQQDAQYNLNSYHYEFSYGLQDILTPRSYVQANLIATQENKDHGTRVDVDYREYNLNVTYTNQFTSTYGGTVNGEIKQRNYGDVSTLFNSKREDISRTISGSISAKILKSLSFNIKALYNKVDSNQNVFAYQKYTLSAGIVKTF